jgi:hypothetical protein
MGLCCVRWLGLNVLCVVLCILSGSGVVHSDLQRAVPRIAYVGCVAVVGLYCVWWLVLCVIVIVSIMWCCLYVAACIVWRLL